MRIKPFSLHIYRSDDPRVRQHDGQVHGPGQPDGPSRPVLGKKVMGLRFGKVKLPPLDPHAPTYVNPHLGVTHADGKKQYTFDGKPLFEAYAHGASKPAKEAGQPRGKIGEGFFHTVTTKYNDASPVLRKSPHQKWRQTNLSEVMKKAEVANELVNVLLGTDEETRRMAQHFAIEVLKEVRGGQPVYYTRAVNGFTLRQHRRNPSAYPELPSASVRAKAEELCAAMDWLYSKGFVHSDIHLSNVMFDRNTGKLVLIDMDAPVRADKPNTNASDLRKALAG